MKLQSLGVPYLLLRRGGTKLPIEKRKGGGGWNKRREVIKKSVRKKETLGKHQKGVSWEKVTTAQEAIARGPGHHRSSSKLDEYRIVSGRKGDKARGNGGREGRVNNYLRWE